MLRVLREFWRDQRGVAMILVAIMIPVLIGFSLLAIDMSRLNSHHNDLQKGIDALSLAAAAELDGRSDSITRANSAITNLVSNKTLLSTSGDHALVLADVTVTYLTGIPASDDTAISTAGVDAGGTNWASTDPKAVSFAEVTVNASGLTDGAGAFATIFPASLFGGKDKLEIQPQAVAGFVQSICETVPLFMCNPFETSDPATSKTIQQAFALGDTYGREFRVLKVDSNPGPGNFGLVDNNLSSIRDAIAMGTSGTCYNRDALTTKTGVTLGQVNTGLNTRFDLYSGSLNKQTKNWQYRPASNVRKGQKNGCSKYDPVTDNTALPLPPGTNYNDSKGMSDPIGSQGFWTNYWQVNHGAAYPTVPSATNPTGTTTAPASRYDVYKYEIAKGLVDDKSTAPTKETGTPSCYKGDDPTPDPDRRLLNMAIVNCLANQAKLNGHVQLKPDGYVSVFVNTPIQKQDNTKDPEDPSAGEKPISLEIVDVDGGFANNTLVDKAFRNEAQLYR
ncbi:pilus assembly protein TadG-related protein [Mesorhizobium sp. ESP7-2]|uniref:TadE/TadG family type IV pilus assembly protein n=1 Tax=Mesorhizobium sp. ESP7-2 TaxID=2876622 RepID=UPI001CC90DF8|nr:pilus assembly protein TadG-related protein [Mesorhizobium sp. ESP7-2]MBZ9710481.1 pilus assembly protein TadG-related protein [Mesorhizobium sp. ESP7-2]